MKILIVSGFLGAGKTTFIKHLAKRSGLRFVVLENEYGDVGIDGDLLSGDKEINVWELTEGCICCSMKDSFASSVLTIANSLDPEYLVVEPTGVGMLSNILSNLAKITYDRIEVLSPVTVMDVRSIREGFLEYPEIFRDHILHTGMLFLSKTDALGAGKEGMIAQAEEMIRSVDPSLTVIPDYHAAEDVIFQDLFRTALDGTKEVKSCKENVAFDSVSIRKPGRISPEELIVFMEELILGKYGKIERAKGIVDTDEERIRFDLAGDYYTISGDDTGAEAKCIFIGTDLKGDRLTAKMNDYSQPVLDRILPHAQQAESVR